MKSPKPLAFHDVGSDVKDFADPDINLKGRGVHGTAAMELPHTFVSAAADRIPRPTIGNYFAKLRPQASQLRLIYWPLPWDMGAHAAPNRSVIGYYLSGAEVHSAGGNRNLPPTAVNVANVVRQSRQ